MTRKFVAAAVAAAIVVPLSTTPAFAYDLPTDITDTLDNFGYTADDVDKLEAWLDTDEGKEVVAAVEADVDDGTLDEYSNLAPAIKAVPPSEADKITAADVKEALGEDTLKPLQDFGYTDEDLPKLAQYLIAPENLDTTLALVDGGTEAIDPTTVLPKLYKAVPPSGEINKNSELFNQIKEMITSKPEILKHLGYSEAQAGKLAEALVSKENLGTAMEMLAALEGGDYAGMLSSAFDIAGNFSSDENMKPDEFGTLQIVETVMGIISGISALVTIYNLIHQFAPGVLPF